jgi:hypothetical protein
MSIVDSTTLEDRFWDKVFRGTGDGCWTWFAGKSNGYGRMFLGRENGRSFHEYAHRYSWMIHHDGRQIPEGMEIDHTCCNRACVNPAHLELVSATENKTREGERQTHCIKGHAYTSENTYLDPNGYRRCRRCAAERRAA